MRSYGSMAALLACAVLSIAACTESARAAGSERPGLASAPISAPATSSGGPSLTPTASPSAGPSPAFLAAHASAYIAAVQAYARKDTDRALPADVCSATFTELEFVAHRSSAYQAQPTLAQFVAAAASIDWSCEMRRVGDIRTGVLGLSNLVPALAALSH